MSLRSGTNSPTQQTSTPSTAATGAAVADLPSGLTVEAVYGVFESCPLGIFQVDVNLKIVYANRVALEIAGLKSASGLSLSDLLDDANRDILRRHFSQRLFGESGEYDLELRDARSGDKVPIRIAAVPLVNEKGKVTGSIGIFRTTLCERALEIVDRATKKGSNYREILYDIAMGLNQVLPFDMCLVSVFNEDNTNTRTVFAWSPQKSPRWPGRAFDLNPRLAEWSRNPELYLVRDSSEFAKEYGIPAPRDGKGRPSQYGPSSFVRCPVVFENRVIAGVIIIRNRLNGFSDADVELLQRLPFDKAVLAALYLEKIAALDFKHSLIEEISKSRSLHLFSQEVAALMVNQLARQYDWANISIFSADKRSRRFELIAQSSKGNCGFPDGYTQALDEGLLGSSFAKDDPVNVPDVGLDARYKDVCPDTRSELCMRIMQGGEVVGLLDIEDSRTNAFSKEEVRGLEELLKAIGGFLEKRWIENLVNATFQCTPAAVLAVDSDGSILKANPAATTLLGYSEEELKAKRLHELFADPSIANEVVNTTKTTSSELILLDKDNTKVDVILAASSMGDQAGVVISCRDISSYQRQEEIRMLSEIFYEVAAQTKPPLALTFDWLRQLREQRQGKEDGNGTRVDLIDKIVRQLRKVQLTYDRLAFYKGVEKPCPENIIFLDAHSLIQDILNEFPQCEVEQVKINWSASRTLLQVDPAQISYALETTLAYLLRFLPQEQVLNVVAEDRRVGGKAGLCIRMESPVKPNPQSPQQQVDVYLTRIKNDISFGFQSVAELVEGNGGEFHDCCAGQEGQIFEFLFPAATQEAV